MMLSTEKNKCLVKNYLNIYLLMSQMKNKYDI